MKQKHKPSQLLWTQIPAKHPQTVSQSPGPAPCEDADSQVCLCDGIGLAVSGALFYATGSLSGLWFPQTVTHYALKRAPGQWPPQTWQISAEAPLFYAAIGP